MALNKYLSNDEINELLKLDLYSRCKLLVSILFMDKVDKAGEPYINHLLRVSENMTTIDGKILGLLHDVVEDIEDITFEDLIAFGVNKEIIEALRLVTNEKSKEKLTKEEKLAKYNAKISTIIASNNSLAIELKLNDMKDNYNQERLSKLTSDEQNWFELKYGQNIKRLLKVNRKGN